MNEQVSRKILIIHDDLKQAEPLKRSIESLQHEVVLIADMEIPVWQPYFGTFDLILLSEDIACIAPVDFILQLADNPMTSLIPVMIIDASTENFQERVYDLMLHGAAAVFPRNQEAVRVAEFVSKAIQRLQFGWLDPVTGLLSGPPLYRMISRMCDHSRTDWYFLQVKLLGLQSYNLGYEYDEGDRLLESIGSMLKASVSDSSTEADIVGRLSGANFCILTKNRRIESMCRDIRIKSERIIRKFYSAFELMKGHMTIEGGTAAGDYYLCEVIVGGVKIPASWDRNANYLFDLAGEVVTLVQNEDLGFKIISG